ncbi:uncharacterized protein [Drosophila pseudoobscura]|uniref:Uncharacterized protein isoform X1 n=1 Tax=Drosophila pseudoobscura pseudoobscura TaxID=46245 RepID=A0A6I8W115_DROPS|nr:uncharacterized protein LOC6902943 isoform X1 [Drosophila pseudoobscura]
MMAIAQSYDFTDHKLCGAARWPWAKPSSRYSRKLYRTCLQAGARDRGPHPRRWQCLSHLQRHDPGARSWAERETGCSKRFECQLGVEENPWEFRLSAGQPLARTCSTARRASVCHPTDLLPPMTRLLCSLYIL